MKGKAAFVSVWLALAGVAHGAVACSRRDSGTEQKAGAAAVETPQGPLEQFFPVLVYRTGPYAPNGVPFANGYVDYLQLVNARDGGINGVKISYEECETGYATDRGVECYERLKGKGPTGATAFHPMSTGVTLAVTDKALTDHIPVITAGYGRADSVDGTAFSWNFPLGGTYWDAADILVQHVGKLSGGVEHLKGKKIALVYHDSPYGKEPIALLEDRAKKYGYQYSALPVTHPGVEQKAIWLQIRQAPPDYLFLWGWGVMNSAAIKEAVAVGYPREKMFGVWWSGAEPDVKPAGDGAKGYSALVFLAPAGQGQVHKQILEYLHDRGKGTGPREAVGEVLYNRGLTAAMMTVEAVKRAQSKFGAKPLTGTEVRWGLEHLALDEQAIDKLGFTGFMLPIQTSCTDHSGGSRSQIQSWDGQRWVVEPTMYQPDVESIRAMIRSSSDQYVEAKKLTKRDCAKDI